MGIQFSKINQLSTSYKEISEILTPEICAIIDEDAISNIQILSGSEDEERNLYDISFQLESIVPFELFIEAREEIDLNMAIIENDSQVNRYLALIRSKINTLLELIQDLTKFHTYKIKYWGDAAWESMEDDGFIVNPIFLIAHKKPKVNLRVMYLYKICYIANLRDYIDSKLDPGKVFETIKPLPIEDWPEHLRVPTRHGVYHPGTKSMQSKSEISCITDTPIQDFKSLITQEYHGQIEEIKNILRNVSPPLINDNNNWINSRSAARVFFTALIEAGLTSTDSYDTAGAILNQTFGVNKSSVVKIPKAEYRTPKSIAIYKEQFKHEIDIIKSDHKIKC